MPVQRLICRFRIVIRLFSFSHANRSPFFHTGSFESYHYIQFQWNYYVIFIKFPRKRMYAREAAGLDNEGWWSCISRKVPGKGLLRWQRVRLKKLGQFLERCGRWGRADAVKDAKRGREWGVKGRAGLRSKGCAKLLHRMV